MVLKRFLLSRIYTLPGNIIMSVACQNLLTQVLIILNSTPCILLYF